MTPSDSATLITAGLAALRAEMRDGQGVFATLNCALAFVHVATVPDPAIGLSIRDLALRLPDTTNVCLTGVADRLESLGLIQRQTGRRPDRRLQWLVPTEKGLSLARRVLHPFSAS